MDIFNEINSQGYDVKQRLCVYMYAYGLKSVGVGICIFFFHLWNFDDYSVNKPVICIPVFGSNVVNKINE